MAEGAVSALARDGQAERTLALIKTLAPTRQVRVLATVGVVHDLIDWGQREQVLALIQNLHPDLRTKVLAAASDSLKKNGAQ